MNSQERKFEYLENNPVASFAVFGMDEATGISKSVRVEGEVTAVSGDEGKNALEALEANAEFDTDLEVWGGPVGEVDLTLLALSQTTIRGRVFGEKMPDAPRGEVTNGIWESC